MILCRDETLDTRASVVVLGMFDGVHIGHQELLRSARSLARDSGVPMVVQTFSTHPLCVLDPGRCPPLLTTPEEREVLIEALGADIYYAQPFTREIGDQSAEDFVQALMERWHPVAVVVGFNYTFGHGGLGTPALLRKLGKKLGFQTVVVPAVRLAGGMPVSATQIRAELAAGRAFLAHMLLGRFYIREVTLAERKGGRCTLCWLDNGKQVPGAQLYQSLLQSRGHAYPVLANVRENETVQCSLPETLVLEGRLTLRLLREKFER